MTEAKIQSDVEMKALVEDEEKEAVPSVDAVEDFGKTNATTNEGPKKRPTVRVVAPSNLPPCYRLPVIYQEEATGTKHNQKNRWRSGYVSVPNEGVKKGVTFEANVVPPVNPVSKVTGHWSVSEFDTSSCCCSPYTDTDFCLLAWFCSPVAWACMYEKLKDLGPDHNPKPAIKSFGAISLFMFVLYVVDIACRSADNQEQKYATTRTSSTSNATTMRDLGPIIGVIFVVFSAVARSKIRAHYKIESSQYSSENCCWDVFCVWCFSPCSSLQAYRHMRNAQEHPNLGYISAPPPASAEIIV